MNGFIVVARCLSDDIPLAVFATNQEAERFKDEFVSVDDDGGETVTDAGFQRIRSKEFSNTACNDVGEVVCIHIWQFENGRFI